MSARRILAASALLALAPDSGRSELKVRSPIVEFGEFELEWNGLTTLDKRGSPLTGQRSDTFEIGYGLLPMWSVEIEAERNTFDGTDKWNAITLENTFQLTPQGKYFVDAGFFAEVSFSTLHDQSHAFQLGPILQKEWDDTLGLGFDTLHTINLFFEHGFGHNSDHATGMELAWQSVWLAHPLVNPGFELYSFVTDVANFGRLNNQYNSIGPVITGRTVFAPYGALRYEVGYQFGLTSATPRGAIRWRLEYELAF